MMRRGLAILSVLAIVVPAAGQDIRGLEVCTAEKAMERRTGCLQSNVEFLQQALVKQRRETEARLEAMSREAVAQKSEIAALKSALARLQQELAALKKARPEAK